ncbi:hypothetical protein JCM19239_571 [Vibrio variabilis]|uniref:UPF0313 domain-containing protein n=1 Tax=Vibrio variabilis TaxID=990271 RepID=A0ABQ0JA29_9VIBR|nr:hypothetical protein JCM19239_571 [Vibrio variabilis]
MIPYFISAHPGTEDEDMLNLALWLKKNNFECDQVQNFYPSPMCNATSMYYSETNPLKRVKYKKREDLPVAKGDRQRRLHKALLRYHDPDNWPLIREALVNMGKQYLIGEKPGCLVPAEDLDARTPAQRRKSGRHSEIDLRLSTLKGNQTFVPMVSVVVNKVSAQVNLDITVENLEQESHLRVNKALDSKETIRASHLTIALVMASLLANVLVINLAQKALRSDALVNRKLAS